MSNLEKFLPISECPDADTMNSVCEMYQGMLTQDDTSIETLKLQLESETIQFFKSLSSTNKACYYLLDINNFDSTI